MKNDKTKPPYGRLLNSEGVPVKSRVTHLKVGRTINVGDFCNWKYEIGIDVAEGDSVTAILVVAEKVLGGMIEPKPSGRIVHAWKLQKLPEDQVTPDQREFLGSIELSREMHAYDMQLQEWHRMRSMLEDLGGNAVYTDHKAKWMDEGGNQ